MSESAETVTRIEDLLQLEEEWEALRLENGASVFTSPLWTSIWMKHFHDRASLKALVLWRGEEMTGLAPLVTYRSSFKGYPMTYLCLVGNFAETSEYHDLQFLHGKDVKAASRGLVAGMKGLRWNMLQLRDMRWNSISQEVYAQASALWQCEAMVSKACPFVPLDASKHVLDGFELRSGRKVRRLVESLEREDRIEFAAIARPEDVARSIDTYIEQHKERWANKGGSIFHDPRQSGFLKEVASKGAEKGTVVIYEVRIDGEVASQQVCIRDGVSLRMWKIGMNDKFRAMMPGYLSVYHGLTEAQREGFREYDLGPGPEQYKTKVGGVPRFTYNIQGKRGMADLLSKASHLPGLRRMTAVEGKERGRSEPEGPRE
jgi:CelD/BcsL family acetyltransferase involved in cellulose biosynthesis